MNVNAEPNILKPLVLGILKVIYETLTVGKPEMFDRLLAGALPTFEV